MTTVTKKRAYLEKEKGQRASMKEGKSKRRTKGN